MCQQLGAILPDQDERDRALGQMIKGNVVDDQHVISFESMPQSEVGFICHIVL